MKIYIAGHLGMVGSAITRAVDKSNLHTWFGASRAKLDLKDREQVFEFVAASRPDAIVIAAAKVGGIMANSMQPVEFLTENIQIQCNLMDAAHQAGIERVLFLGSSCIYPKLAPQPLKEEYLLTGELESTNESYAIAKIAGLKLIQAYRRQFGHRWISLMPTNLYGPGDNFDSLTSHVIPGMIAKFIAARQKNEESVVLWGSGAPLREFLFVDDLADACLFALEEIDTDVALNVGSGTEISISDLAEKIKILTAFKGEVRWDKSKPDGTPRKVLDSSKMRSSGWEPKVSLDSGLSLTVRSYLGQFSER